MTADRPGPRDAMIRVQAANRALRASLAELDQALEAALEQGVERGIQQAVDGPPPLDPHRAEHRPGRAPTLAADPELRAFVEARFGAMTFDQIATDVAASFPPERRIRRSAIHQWWTRRKSRKSPVDPR